MRDPCEVAIIWPAGNVTSFKKFGVKTSIPLEKKLKIFVVGNFAIFTVFFFGGPKKV